MHDVILFIYNIEISKFRSYWAFNYITTVIYIISFGISIDVSDLL